MAWLLRRWIIISHWCRANWTYRVGADNKVTVQVLATRACPCIWAAKCHRYSHSLWGICHPGVRPSWQADQNHSPSSGAITMSGRGPLLACNTLCNLMMLSKWNNPAMLADQTELWQWKAISNKMKQISKANESVGTRDYFWRPAYHTS